MRARPVVLTLALVSSCAARTLPPSVAHPLVGEPAPSFQSTDTQSAAVVVPIEDGEARVMVIDFWASWCAGCRASLSFFDAMWREKRSEGVLVVGISVDSDPRDALAFVAGAGAAFPVVLDPEMAIAGRYRVGRVPLTFVVDRRGTVRWVGRDRSDVRRAVDAVLDERPTGREHVSTDEGRLLDGRPSRAMRGRVSHEPVAPREMLAYPSAEASPTAGPTGRAAGGSRPKSP